MQVNRHARLSGPIYAATDHVWLTRLEQSSPYPTFLFLVSQQAVHFEQTMLNHHRYISSTSNVAEVPLQKLVYGPSIILATLCFTALPDRHAYTRFLSLFIEK